MRAEHRLAWFIGGCVFGAIVLGIVLGIVV